MKRRRFLQAIAGFAGLLVAPFTKAKAGLDITGIPSLKTEVWTIKGHNVWGNQMTERIVIHPGQIATSKVIVVTSMSVSRSNQT